MARENAARVVVFGATGRLGRRIVARFAGQGHPVVAVSRREAILDTLPGERHVLDLAEAAPADSPVRGGDIVVNAAHARHTQAILRLCPPDAARLIVLGSIRYRTRFPDRRAEEVRAAARLLQNCQLKWVLLHPTMIYGAQAENNVQRIAALIRRFHVVPLPGSGKSLIQPIHADDAAEAVVRAAQEPRAVGRVIHLAGPRAVPYREFIHAIARAAGARVAVIGLPPALLRAAAMLTRLLPGVPAVSDAEVLRLQEDKAVDIADMQAILALTPRPLEQGLKETFAHPGE